MKILFIKAYIVLGGIITFYFLYCAAKVEWVKNPEPYAEQHALIAGGILFIWVLIMMFVIPFMKIDDIENEPIKKSLQCKNYEEFKDNLQRNCVLDGFVSMETTLFCEGVESTILYKKKMDEIFMIQILKFNEMKDDVVDDTVESCFEQVKIQVGEKKMLANHLHLIQFLCVDRINHAFRKFTKQCSKQDYKRYLLQAGVSFGGKKVYIREADGGILKRKHQYLMKIMNALTLDLIVEEKKEKADQK